MFKTVEGKRYAVKTTSESSTNLFAAIAMIVRDGEASENQVRKDIKKHILDNPEDFLEFYGSYPELIKRARLIPKSEQKGDEACIMAAAKMYGCQIAIYQDEKLVKTYNEYPNARLINLARQEGDLYNLMLESDVDGDLMRGSNDENPDLGMDNEDTPMDIDDQVSDHDQSGLINDTEPVNEGRAVVLLEVGREINDSEAGALVLHEESMDGEGLDEASESRLNASLDNTGAEILEKDGFKRLGTTMMASARRYIWVILLLPRVTDCSKLSEALKASRPGKMHLVVCVHKGMRKRLMENADLRKDFTMYSCTAMTPRNANSCYNNWFASLLITPLILSALKIPCNGIRYESCCVFTKTSKALQLLGCQWDAIKSIIQPDVAEVLKYPNLFACEECQEDCRFRNKPWHLDLSRFSRLPYVEQQENDLWGEIGFFDYGTQNVAPIVQTFRKSFFSNAVTAVKLSWIYGKLEYCAKTVTDKVSWFTYLVLLINGPSMDLHMNDTFSELVNNPNLKKGMYAGCVKNESFRISHLYIESSVSSLMSKDSRLFLLRSEQFKNNMEALKDEAIVIEIIKNYANKWQNPFIVLNRKSESTQLHATNSGETHLIQNFSDSDIPPYQVDPEDERKFDYPRFPGNYKSIREIPLRGRFMRRNFSSVAHLYDQLEAHFPH